MIVEHDVCNILLITNYHSSHNIITVLNCSCLVCVLVLNYSCFTPFEKVRPFMPVYSMFAVGDKIFNANTIKRALIQHDKHHVSSYYI